MMTEVELRDHVGDLMDGWTACEVVGPNEQSDAGFPSVTGNVEDPTTLLVWEFGDEEPDGENGWHSTFGGTEVWRGNLLISVWVEKDVGDRKQREHMRDLRETFLAPTTANTTGFYLGSPSIVSEYDSEAGFTGREMSWPYIRIDEP